MNLRCRGFKGCGLRVCGFLPAYSEDILDLGGRWGPGDKRARVRRWDWPGGEGWGDDRRRN